MGDGGGVSVGCGVGVSVGCGVGVSVGCGVGVPVGSGVGVSVGAGGGLSVGGGGLSVGGGGGMSKGSGLGACWQTGRFLKMGQSQGLYQALGSTPSGTGVARCACHSASRSAPSCRRDLGCAG